MAKKTQLDETDEHPYNKITQDLQAFIDNLTGMKHEIILMLDANEGPNTIQKILVRKICEHSSLSNITKHMHLTHPEHTKKHKRNTTDILYFMIIFA